MDLVPRQFLTGCFLLVLLDLVSAILGVIRQWNKSRLPHLEQLGMTQRQPLPGPRAGAFQADALVPGQRCFRRTTADILWSWACEELEYRLNCVTVHGQSWTLDFADICAFALKAVSHGWSLHCTFLCWLSLGYRNVR